jgi:hypothetical protein
MAGERRTLVDNDPDHANNQVAYDAALPDFKRWRAIAITGYAVGGALLVTGYLLRRSAKAESSSPDTRAAASAQRSQARSRGHGFGALSAMQLSAVPLPEGGGFVSLEWAR